MPPQKQPEERDTRSRSRSGSPRPSEAGDHAMSRRGHVEPRPAATAADAHQPTRSAGGFQPFSPGGYAIRPDELPALEGMFKSTATHVARPTSASAACPDERTPPLFPASLVEDDAGKTPDLEGFNRLLDSIRRADQSQPVGSVISQSMDQFLDLCDKNALMCILSGMMGRPIPEGVQFDSLSIDAQKPVYGLLCVSINRLTASNFISLIHSLIMTNYFNDSYLRVCAALLEKGVDVTFAWHSGLKQLAELSADVAANVVNVIMTAVRLYSRPTELITHIIENLPLVDLSLSPGVLQNITGALTELAKYSEYMLTIGILYIIQRLFTAINGSPQAQEVLARAPHPQPGSNPVVDLVRDGGVSVYNSLIDLINVVFAKPGSMAGVGTRPTPITQARHFCLSLVTGVLLSTGNNQASTDANARQKAIQYLNNARHLLEVLFPEWANDLQQGNIATAIKNAADLVTLLKVQIRDYVEEDAKYPGRVDLAASLALFPILQEQLTLEAFKRHVSSDIAGKLFNLQNDTSSLDGTQDTAASEVEHSGDMLLPFIQSALLANPHMWVNPAERRGLTELQRTDNPIGKAGTAVNKLFEGLFTGVSRGAKLLCYPLHLVREPVIEIFEQSRAAGDFSVPTIDHPFIPDSMIFTQRFAAKHARFIEEYHRLGGDDSQISTLLDTIFGDERDAYISALKLSAVWGPTHNKIRYVMMKTKGGEQRPFIVLEGAIVGKVARIPLSHEGFGDVIPVATEQMLASTVENIKNKLTEGVVSGIRRFSSVCNFGFWRIEQPGDPSSGSSGQQQQNAVDLAVVTGINPVVQAAAVNAASNTVAAAAVAANLLPPAAAAALDDDARDGGVNAGMAAKGGSRRRRASTAKRNNRRKSHNKKSNKRKSSKQSSRKKISRRRQSRRK